MKQIAFSYGGLNAVFGVLEDRTLALLYMGTEEPTVPEDGRPFPAVQVELTGSDNGHFGSRQLLSAAKTPLCYQRHSVMELPDGAEVTFVLENEFITAEAVYRFYKDCATVRSLCRVTNRCADVQGLELVTSFMLVGVEGADAVPMAETMRVMRPYQGWTREVGWQTHTLAECGLNVIGQFSTTRISHTNNGTWSSDEALPMGALLNTRTGRTVLWQIEHNGSWYWEINDVREGHLYLVLTGPNDSENRWWKQLKPGETFESVPTAVSFSSDGFDTALASMNTYRRKIAYVSPGDRHLPIIFNDFMNCLNTDTTTERELPVIDAAAKAGAEIYVVDAGWYAEGFWWPSIGNWEECPKRYPNGFREVFDHVREKGMIPGLWLEIESMGVENERANQLPDNWFFIRHGQRVITRRRYQLDFRNPEVRAFADSVIDRCIRDYGIGYFKIDYNIEAGVGTEYNADSLGDGLLEHNRAYLKWIDGLYERYPNLIIENCSSGGMRMDYAMLAHHSVQSATDQSKFRYTGVIAANLPTAVLPEQIGMWSAPRVSHSDGELTGHMVNGILARMTLSGETHLLNEHQLALVQEGVACCKQMRTKLRTAQVSYPLGLPDYAAPNFCVVHRFDDHTGCLTVYRMEGGKACLDVPLTNVAEVELLYPSTLGATAARTETGVRAVLPDEPSAAIFRLHFDD